MTELMIVGDFAQLEHSIWISLIGNLVDYLLFAWDIKTACLLRTVDYLTNDHAFSGQSEILAHGT